MPVSNLAAVLPPPRRNGYRPPVWLPGGDLQTIVPAIFGGPRLTGQPAEHWVEVQAGTRVRLDVDRPHGTPTGTLLLIHGMGGSSESGYMRYTARAALERGWVAARMNLRTCGGTESAARTLYNAGQSDDVVRVLESFERSEEFPRPYLAAGFSLGGNLLLRYAGHAGKTSPIEAFAAVNAPVDLAACLLDLELPRNRIYQHYYVNKLCAHLRRVRRLRGWPDDPPRAREIRTVRRFDDAYTAHDAGFPSSVEYYAWASAARCLSGIRRPTMVLSATNDPFVSVGMFERFRGLRGIDFVHPRAGGHCGYWQAGRPRNWAAEAVVDYLGARVETS